MPINTERSVRPTAQGIACSRMGQRTTLNQPVSTKKAGVSPMTAGGWGVKLIPFSNAANALAPEGWIR